MSAPTLPAPEHAAAAPQFHGPVALLVVHSAGPEHATLAEAWRRRLPDHVVVVGNTGLLPGRVAFAVRSATRTDLAAFLRSIVPQLPTEGGDSPGGVLDFPAWNELVAKLGFGTDLMLAPDPAPAGVRN